MRKRIEYVCPECGNDMCVDMTDYEMDSNCLCLKHFCPKCETVWNEYFILEYDGYSLNGKTFDREGVDITDI